MSLTSLRWLQWLVAMATFVAIVTITGAVVSVIKLTALRQHADDLRTQLTRGHALVAQLESVVTRRADGVRSLWNASQLSDIDIDRLVSCDLERAEPVRPDARSFPYLLMIARLSNWRERIVRDHIPRDDRSERAALGIVNRIEAASGGQYESFFGAPAPTLWTGLALMMSVGADLSDDQRRRLPADCGDKKGDAGACFEKAFSLLAPDKRVLWEKRASEYAERYSIRNDIESVIGVECMGQVGVLKWSLDSLSSLPTLPLKSPPPLHL